MVIVLRKDIPVLTDADWEKACLPLTWRSVIWDVSRRTAYFFDTNGHGLSLNRHTIQDDGTVTPSVVCPLTGCGFHEFVKLEGWESKSL